MRHKTVEQVSVEPRELRHLLSMVMLSLSILVSACTIVQEADGVGDIQDNSASNQPWEEQGEIWLAFDSEQSPLEVITHAFEVWLAQYAHVNAPNDVALLASRIDAIEAVSDPFFTGEYDFVFYVEYSIRPRSNPSRWLAGDGRLGTDGWIVAKNHYVGVQISGENVRVLILGPCPMC